jgi:hypothetical protein
MAVLSFFMAAPICFTSFLASLRLLSATEGQLVLVSCGALPELCTGAAYLAAYLTLADARYCAQFVHFTYHVTGRVKRARAFVRSFNHTPS